MNSKDAYDNFVQIVGAKLTEWLPENTVQLDHQPNTGGGASGNDNSETWLSVQPLPPEQSRLEFRSFDVNGNQVYRSSFKADVILKFYGPNATRALMTLRDEMRKAKDQKPFSPVVFLGEGNAINATTFLSARWEERATSLLKFSVCYEVVNDLTILLVELIQLNGSLIEKDSSTLTTSSEIEI